MNARITGVAQHRAGDGYEPRDGRHGQWYHHLSPIWALVRSGCWSLLSSGGASSVRRPQYWRLGRVPGAPRASDTSATKSKTAHLPPAAIPTLEQHTPAARQHTLPPPPPMSSGPSPGLRPLGTPACYPPMHAIFAPAASLLHHDAPPNELQRFAPSSQATRFAPWLRRKVERATTSAECTPYYLPCLPMNRETLRLLLLCATSPPHLPHISVVRPLCALHCPSWRATGNVAATRTTQRLRPRPCCPPSPAWQS
jgi:hypothetical protein